MFNDYDEKSWMSLKLKYRCLVTIVPFIFIVLGLFTALPLASFYGTFLGIPENSPVKEHPNGNYFMLLFLGTLTIVVVLFATMGCLFNKYFLGVCWGCTPKEARQRMVDGQFPNEWFKS